MNWLPNYFDDLQGHDMVLFFPLFSMDKILERYERYSYAEKALISAESESEGNWCHEYRKLKAKIETIQKCHK